jgi:hypothetical protein
MPISTGGEYDAGRGGGEGADEGAEPLLPRKQHRADGEEDDFHDASFAGRCSTCPPPSPERTSWHSRPP